MCSVGTSENMMIMHNFVEWSFGWLVGIGRIVVGFFGQRQRTFDRLCMMVQFSSYDTDGV